MKSKYSVIVFKIFEKKPPNISYFNLSHIESQHFTSMKFCDIETVCYFLKCIFLFLPANLTTKFPAYEKVLWNGGKIVFYVLYVLCQMK